MGPCADRDLDMENPLLDIIAVEFHTSKGFIVPASEHASSEFDLLHFTSQLDGPSTSNNLPLIYAGLIRPLTMIIPVLQNPYSFYPSASRYHLLSIYHIG